jgi:hypothetical protein
VSVYDDLHSTIVLSFIEDLEMKNPTFKLPDRPLQTYPVNALDGRFPWIPRASDCAIGKFFAFPVSRDFLGVDHISLHSTGRHQALPDLPFGDVVTDAHGKDPAKWQICASSISRDPSFQRFRDLVSGTFIAEPCMLECGSV